MNHHNGWYHHSHSQQFKNILEETSAAPALTTSKSTSPAQDLIHFEPNTIDLQALQHGRHAASLGKQKQEGLKEPNPAPVPALAPNRFTIEPVVWYYLKEVFKYSLIGCSLLSRCSRCACSSGVQDSDPLLPPTWWRPLPELFPESLNKQRLVLKVIKCKQRKILNHTLFTAF